MADGTMGGSVKDTRNMAPIDGATIEAKSNGDDTKTTSDKDGAWGMDVPAGTYDVTVTADGYDPGEYPGIHVQDANPTDMNFALWPKEG